MRIEGTVIVSTARSCYVRSSAQKVRLVADTIRGKAVLQALTILSFTNKKASEIVRKVLLSAVSNAKHNFSSEIDSLIVTRIFVDVGPSLKRVMPRAKGRADHILKRTSHITVVVSNSLKIGNG